MLSPGEVTRYFHKGSDKCGLSPCSPGKEEHQRVWWKRPEPFRQKQRRHREGGQREGLSVSRRAEATSQAGDRWAASHLSPPPPGARATAVMALHLDSKSARNFLTGGGVFRVNVHPQVPRCHRLAERPVSVPWGVRLGHFMGIQGRLQSALPLTRPLSQLVAVPGATCSTRESSLGSRTGCRRRRPLGP